MEKVVFSAHLLSIPTSEIGDIRPESYAFFLLRRVSVRGQASTKTAKNGLRRKNSPAMTKNRRSQAKKIVLAGARKVAFFGAPRISTPYCRLEASPTFFGERGLPIRLATPAAEIQPSLSYLVFLSVSRRLLFRTASSTESSLSIVATCTSYLSPSFVIPYSGCNISPCCPYECNICLVSHPPYPGLRFNGFS